MQDAYAEQIASALTQLIQQMQTLNNHLLQIQTQLNRIASKPS